MRTQAGLEQSQEVPERPQAAPAPAITSPQLLLALQRGAGNAAVTRALQRRQLQRFDAAGGGHQGMERDVAGLDPHGGLASEKRLKEGDPKAGTREAGVNAVYAGNYMQDFSQINVPKFQEILSSLPKEPVTDPKGDTIGAKGAEAVSTALIRALAILEVGPRLADSVVAGNMQQYRPEQHDDQPIGYSAKTDTVVRDSKSGTLRPGRAAVEGGKFPNTAVDTVDKDRDAQLKGSAVPGIQVENPELFKASPAGLQNHIYNSVEWTKNHWMQAAQAGPNDQGRFHVGAGLHAIEDYFAHSNFIEVALNQYIGTLAKGSPLAKDGKKSPQGTFVDTLYDQKVGKRQVVTTGSVGPMDMRSSIGHILLPKVPMLQKAIDKTIDKAFHLVEANKVSGWAGLKTTFADDRPAAAVLALGDGLDGAGITLPVPVGINVHWDEYEVPVLPDISIPTDVSVRTAERPVTSALSSYIEFVRSAHMWMDRIQGVLDTVGWFLWPVKKALEWALGKIRALIKEELEKVREAVKHQLAMLIVDLLDTISGVDTRKEKDRSIGDALHHAHDAVEGFEQQTSLQYRLLPGGDLADLSADELEPIVGPVTPSPTGGWVAKNPLPPSHSEIAKDHAPHADEDKLVTHGRAPGDLHEPEDGSIFYSIARALAVEADRHVLRQVELMWAAQGSLYGDNQALDASKVTVGHDAFAKEASGRSDAEGKRAAKQGFKHAQTDAGNKALLDKRPEVRDLLNMVDLIIAHPDDSTWWRPVVDGAVSGNEKKVAEHIRARNETRGARRRVGP